MKISFDLNRIDSKEVKNLVQEMEFLHSEQIGSWGSDLHILFATMQQRQDFINDLWASGYQFTDNVEKFSTHKDFPFSKILPYGVEIPFVVSLEDSLIKHPTYQYS